MRSGCASVATRLTVSLAHPLLPVALALAVSEDYLSAHLRPLQLTPDVGSRYQLRRFPLSS